MCQCLLRPWSNVLRITLLTDSRYYTVPHIVSCRSLTDLISRRRHQIRLHAIGPASNCSLEGTASVWPRLAFAFVACGGALDTHAAVLRRRDPSFLLTDAAFVGGLILLHGSRYIRRTHRTFKSIAAHYTPTPLQIPTTPRHKLEKSSN